MPMPKVRMEVSRLNEGEMDHLLTIERQAFPGRRMVRYYHGGIACIEVEGKEARDLLAAAAIGSDDPAFESSSQIQARADLQSELDLGREADAARSAFG